MGTRIKAIPAQVYSRVVGYYTPVENWNRGKREEFKQRETVDIEGAGSDERSGSD